METIKQQNGKAPGVGTVQTGDKPSPTIKQLEEWLKRDLQMALNVLDAVYTDPDLMRMVAHHMKGRLDNAREKEALKRQGDLFKKQSEE